MITVSKFGPDYIAKHATSAILESGYGQAMAEITDIPFSTEVLLNCNEGARPLFG
jgi:hypothetical protein